MGLFNKNKDSELIDEIKNLTNLSPPQNNFDMNTNPQMFPPKENDFFIRTL